MRTPGRVCVFLVKCAFLTASVLAQEPEYIPMNPAHGSTAVVVGEVPLLYTAQILPVDGEGRVQGNDLPGQVEAVFRNLTVVLTAGGTTLDKVVRLNLYAASDDAARAARAAVAARYPGKATPAVSVVAGKLPHPDALVALDAVATTKRTPAAKTAAYVSGPASGKSPRLAEGAILPAGPKVYIAGQAEPGNLREATRKTMASLKATLKHLGMQTSQIAQLKAFVQPMSSAGEARDEISQFFGDEPVPPLVFVEWISTLPIEIELVAGTAQTQPAGQGSVLEFITPPGMQASPLFSRVVRVNHGRTIYLPGLHAPSAVEPESECREVFTALRGMLEAAGSDFRHLVKATYYVSTEQASQQLNAIRPDYYDPQRPPAASKAVVPGVGVAGRALTLDMIAVPVPSGK